MHAVCTPGYGLENPLSETACVVLHQCPLLGHGKSVVLSSFCFLHDLLNVLISLSTLEIDKREQSRQCQPDIAPNTNAHACIVVAVKLVVLVSTNASCDVVEHSRGNNSLCVWKSSVAPVGLERLRCVGAVDRFRGGRQGNGIGERDEDQGEGDETPAIVADVVEFEVVRGKVGLRRRAEP